MTADRKVELSPSDRDLRVEIYRHFSQTTQAPAETTLAKRMDTNVENIQESLYRLAAQHAIALAPGSTSIWMAHPFSAVPTAYPVHTTRGRYWANCAWDAFGIPAVLDIGESRTPTQCAGTGVPIELGVQEGRPRTQEGLVHFAVRPRDFWANVGFT